MSNYSGSKYQNDPNTSWFKALKLIKEGSTVLDIGCSSGSFGHELISRKKCTVDGVEIDLLDREKASKKLRKVYDFNIETNVPQNLIDAYDYVYFGDVIEHLHNPVKALINTKKLLRPNGRVIFSIPNMAHMSVRYMLLGGHFSYGETGLLDKTHLHFYDEDEVRRLFAESGYELKDLDYVQRDIPRDVQRKILKDLGLSASKKFLDETKKPQASGYQFVGYAIPSTTVAKVPSRTKISPSINEMEKHITYVKKVHGAQIRSYRKRIEELEDEVKAKEQEYERLLSLKSRTITHKIIDKILARK